MTFQPGQSGNPGGRPKDRPFQTALMMEAKLAEQGLACEAPKGSLRHIARQLLERASEDTISAREVADRIDGKPVALFPVDEDGNPIGRLSEGDLIAELTHLAQESGAEIHIGIRSGKKQKMINGSGGR